MKTLYEYATEQMNTSIQHYFELVSKTDNFQKFDEEVFKDRYACQMILAGKSQNYEGASPKQCLDAVSRVGAIQFDIEKGVSAYVYENSRKYVEELLEKAKAISGSFKLALC